MLLSKIYSIFECPGAKATSFLIITCRAHLQSSSLYLTTNRPRPLQRPRSARDWQAPEGRSVPGQGK
jgi:hypothetical protein